MYSGSGSSGSVGTGEGYRCAEELTSVAIVSVLGGCCCDAMVTCVETLYYCESKAV